MDDVFFKWCESSLVWLPEKGMGFLNHEPIDYSESYFEEYQRRAKTEIGENLNNARIEFVAKHYTGPLIDVGIGSGIFVETRPETYGFDINQSALNWLDDRGLFADPLNTNIQARTFWDSIEHILIPSEYLNCKYVFVSIPVFKDGAIINSKHYKPGEHLWYWTKDGFIDWMDSHGYELLEYSDFEQEWRQDIGSFAFELRR